MATKKDKKRILILSTAYHPFVGGAEVAIKEITDRLGVEFEFDLITAKIDKKLPDEESVGNVSVYRIGFGNETLDKMLLPFRGAFLINKLNKKHRYFCMWGMMVTFGSGAGYLHNIIQTILFKKKIPIILTLQEGDSENHLTYRWFGLIALSWKAALKMTDRLTGISTFLLNRAKKNGFKGKSFLVPNGVDLKVFKEKVAEADSQTVQRYLGKKPEDIFLVTFGRLVHKNATDSVISALQYLPSNIHFVVIGKGELGFELQKQARELGVDQRVRFLGFIPYKDLPKYLSACDIFVRPSRSEGFGNSFIEAMAFGLPVIATPVGGITDFIHDKETGVFCSPDNPQSIAKAVKSLIDDRETTLRIVRQGRALVEDRYGWDRIAGEMKDVFDKIPNNI